MDENTVVGQLEELAESLDIEVRYEPIRKEGAFYPGGLCRLQEKYVLILNSRATIRDKTEALAKAVNRFDLSKIYLRPGVREFLEGFSE